MPERKSKLSLSLRMVAGAGAAAALLAAAPAAQAQKIVCWKDNAGKVIGCGDRVPPEFQKNESKTLDNRGITRKTTVSAEEAARLKAEADKKAAIKLEEDRRIAEQRRQDTALINTYTSAGEIDVRRDRELQVVDLQIQQLKAAVKGAVDAHTTQKSRYANFEKRGKVPDNVKDDLKLAAEEEDRIKTRIADKEKDKERITASYAQQKARFIELKGGPAAAPATPAPAKK
ncbi:MAG: hypothetical protein K2Y31_09830 [Burkholderiales bacterium]|jgi:hypothetical protein|nr:hypothetical protein [Burkholderiales bacterium]